MFISRFYNKSRKENPQKLTQLGSRSHPRHLVGKRTAQKDTIIDITSDSQVNSNFPYRWSPASLTFNNYFYLFLYLYLNLVWSGQLGFNCWAFFTPAFRFCSLLISSQGVLLIWITVGHVPIASAVGAGGVCCDIFLSLITSLFSLPLSGRRPDLD